MLHSLLRTATLACCVLGPLAAQTVYPKGTTIWLSDDTYDGYTVFTSPAGEATVIDMAGNIVKQWASPIAGHELRLVEPLDNGNILAVSRVPGTRSNIVLEFDQTGNLVWGYALPTSLGFIHHEVERLPNGNTLLLCAREVPVPAISPVPLEDDYIIEITPEGTLAWAWITYQHFEEFGFTAEARQLISAQGGDWAHANAVHPLPPNTHTNPAFAEGNLVVSQRFTNTVFIIDRTTGAIVWQSGPNNPLTLGQHAPYMIPMGLPGAGNILVFDNGSGTGYPLEGRAPGFSSVKEIDPVSSSVGWRYTAGSSGLFPFLFSSDIVSNAQRLPNGNTLICSGVKGRLFEVNPVGTIVWEYMSPLTRLTRVGSSTTYLIYRAYRVPLEWLQ